MHIGVTREGQGRDLDRLCERGVRLHFVETRTATDARAVLDIRRLLAEIRPHVIQTWLARMEIWGGLAAMTARIPWILSERSSWHDHGLRAVTRQQIAARATAIVANSEAGALHWRQRRAPHQQIHVVPNGVPLEAVDAVSPMPRAELGVGVDDELLVYVGRLAEQKNVPLLMQVIIESIARRPRLHAVICGIGPLTAAARELAMRSPFAARIHFRGFVDDVWRVMKTADVFLSTSQIEGCPNTVMEAMACGCPMVLSNIPQHREFVSDDVAELFPTTSPAMAVDAIERTLADRPAAAARAARARDACASFSVASMARHYYQIYGSIAAAAADHRSQPALNSSP